MRGGHEGRTNVSALIAKPYRAAYLGLLLPPRIPAASTSSLSRQADHVREVTIPPSVKYGYPVSTIEEVEWLARREVTDDDAIDGDEDKPSRRRPCPGCLRRTHVPYWTLPFRDRTLERWFRRLCRPASIAGHGLQFLGLGALAIADLGEVLKRNSQPGLARGSAQLFLVQDTLRILAVAVSAVLAVLLATKAITSTAASVDALLSVVPLSLYALTLFDGDDDRRVTLPHALVFAACLMFMARHGVGMHFALYAIIAVPPIIVQMLLNREYVAVFVQLAVLANYYFIAVHVEIINRRMFLTSEALWKTVAAGSSAEVAFLRCALSDTNQLLSLCSQRAASPGDDEVAAQLCRDESIPTSHVSVPRQEVRSQVVCVVSWEGLLKTTHPEEPPPFWHRESLARVRKRVCDHHVAERVARTLLAMLPTLRLVASAGDQWIVASMLHSPPSAMAPRCGAQSATESRFSDAAVQQAYVFVSRLPALVAAEHDAPRKDRFRDGALLERCPSAVFRRPPLPDDADGSHVPTCVLHAGDVCVMDPSACFQPGESGAAHPTHGHPLFVAGRPVTEAAYLARHNATRMQGVRLGDFTSARYSPLPTCLATESFMWRLRAAVESHPTRSDAASANSMVWMDTVLREMFQRTRRPHRPVFASMLMRPGDLNPGLIRDGLTFASSTPWKVAGLERPLCISVGRVFWAGSMDAWILQHRNGIVATAARSPRQHHHVDPAVGGHTCVSCPSRALPQQPAAPLIQLYATSDIDDEKVPAAARDDDILFQPRRPDGGFDTVRPPWCTHDGDGDSAGGNTDRLGARKQRSKCHMVE